jgi:hypothetical protein
MVQASLARPKPTRSTYAGTASPWLRLARCGLSRNGVAANPKRGRPAKPNAGPGLTRALTMRAVDRRCLGTALLPQEKICVCCGAPFERREFTRDGRRALRQPQQWRRQRFCSTECVRHYRLQGPITETLPPYLQVLEPIKPGPQR